MAELTSSPPIDLSNGAIDFNVQIYYGDRGERGVRETMWSDRGMEVSIDFLVRWVDRIKFLYLLRGSCGYNGQDYWRHIPISLPMIDSDVISDLDEREGVDHYPWNRYFCSSIGECTPIKVRTTSKDLEYTGAEGWPYYDKVIIPTRWAVPLYVIADEPYDPATPGKDPSGYPYTTTHSHTTGDVFSPYTNAFKFKTEETPANEANIGIFRAKQELLITRHSMPYIDTVALDDLIGKVNLDPIQIGADLNPPESMLYLGYEREPHINPSNGKVVYDVTHRLAVVGPVRDQNGDKKESWNYYMNRKGYWDKLVLKDNPAKGVYETEEFKCKLFPEYVLCDAGEPVDDLGGGE